MNSQTVSLDGMLRDLEQRGGSMRDATVTKPWVWVRLVGARRGTSTIRVEIVDLDEGQVRDGLISIGWSTKGRSTSKEWVIESEADRGALRSELVDALQNQIGPRQEHTFTEIIPGSDAGFGQVGCLLILVSAPVGGLVGFVIVLVVTDLGAAVGAAIIGVAAGWLSGGFAAWFGVRLAERIRRLRYRADDIGLAFALVAPAIIALMVALLIGVAEAYGGLDRFIRSLLPQ
jgi:hypothetical protein